MSSSGTSPRIDPNRLPPDVHFEFGHTPDAPRQARKAVAPLFDGPADPIADDVELTVSELVSNVIRHTTGGGLMDAWDPKPDVPLRVEVSDSDPTLPHPPAVPQELGGHGLGLVAAVADAWGVDSTSHGKSVWAEFDRKKRQS